MSKKGVPVGSEYRLIFAGLGQSGDDSTKEVRTLNKVWMNVT